jgi:RNA polymerase sigma factor (sigma-70 family)
MSDVSADTAHLNRWMERIRAGDMGAREELFRGIGSRLEAMARQMLRRFPGVQRWAETGDVLQSSLIRLLRALDQVQFASMREFYGLAATQIRRELIDLARHFAGPHNAAAHHESWAVEEAAEPVSEFHQWAAFHEAVEKLPVEEREVVSLVFYHNWTQAQVADLFQVHLRTVRRWWQAALVKLHDVMKPVM